MSNENIRAVCSAYEIRSIWSFSKYRFIELFYNVALTFDSRNISNSHSKQWINYSFGLVIGFRIQFICRLRIFLNRIEEIRLMRGSVSPAEYYNEYYTLDTFYTSLHF